MGRFGFSRLLQANRSETPPAVENRTSTSERALAKVLPVQLPVVIHPPCLSSAGACRSLVGQVKHQPQHICARCIRSGAHDFNFAVDGQCHRFFAKLIFCQFALRAPE